MPHTVLAPAPHLVGKLRHRTGRDVLTAVLGGAVRLSSEPSREGPYSHRKVLDTGTVGALADAPECQPLGLARGTHAAAVPRWWRPTQAEQWGHIRLGGVGVSMSLSGEQ